MDEQNVTIAELKAQNETPFVVIDHEGLFTFVNDVFCEQYSWKREDLIGNGVAMIMPKAMEEAHSMGFSRFITTETPKYLRQHLMLELVTGDGRHFPVDHFIMAEKLEDGRWQFGATLVTPPVEAAA